MYLIVLALSLHLLPLHLPKHSERVILIIRQTHFSHLNVGEGNGGGVCGGGGGGERVLFISMQHLMRNFEFSPA